MKIIFDDKSECEMNDYWVRATKVKYGYKTDAEVKKHHIAHVNHMWKKKRWCDKFGEYDFGVASLYHNGVFKNKAELASEVCYTDLRAVLMGMAFSELTKGKGKVLALDGDGNATEYGGKKKVKGKLEDFLTKKVEK